MDESTLEYRLERLEFQNGAALAFRRARMWYHEDGDDIVIDQVDTSPQEIDSMLAEIAEPDGTLPEIREIVYNMKLSGYPPIAFFYHPIKGKGVGVRLERRPKGTAVLSFSQEDARSMFSKQWTLREVTNGKISSEKNVWQFHGWRHEH
jgi:hypothetical protein